MDWAEGSPASADTDIAIVQVLVRVITYPERGDRQMTYRTLLLQTLAATLIAMFMVWSIYRDNRFAKPNNDWLKGLSRLPDKLNLGIRVFLVFGAMFLLGDLLWVTGPLVHGLYSYVLKQLGLQGAQLLMGVGVIVGGLSAYWFKRKNQTAYGFVEIIFAGALGIATARQMGPTASLSGSVAALIGAVYVVSRGAGNIMEGWQEGGNL